GDRPYAAAIRTSAAIEGTEWRQEMHAPFTSGEDRIGGAGNQGGSRPVRPAVGEPSHTPSNRQAPPSPRRAQAILEASEAWLAPMTTGPAGMPTGWSPSPSCPRCWI